MRCKRLKKFGVVGIFIISFIVIYLLGIDEHIQEVDYDTKFDYPLDIDIKELILHFLSDTQLDLTPINTYNYNFIINCWNKCQDKSSENIELVFLVKSAVKNLQQRMAIRETWGRESHTVRTLFFLGVNPSEDHLLRLSIKNESLSFGDIVRSDFIDTYYNNTIKTMLAFKWAYTYCQNAQFYMFSDDDMYISVKNVKKFLENPYGYSRHNDETLNFIDTMRYKRSARALESANDDSFVVDESKILFTGFVFHSSPQRHLGSKWRVSLSEYPWNRWPPYVTAGAYILSRQTLHLMYAASHYVMHFRFDDIYLGIVAKKAGIVPYHCEEFYFYKKNYNVPNYRFVIASHGYHDPLELKRVWNELNSYGYA